MLISRQWIESLMSPAGGETMSDEAFGDAVTSLGLEVEGVTRFGDDLRTVVVAEVRGIEPHPNADKLRLVDVFDGERTIKVVCGAPNVPESGGKIAFARLGSVLPGGFEIGAREIRGVHSEGMICAEEELGIGPDGDGIMVLPSDWQPGTPLPEAVPGIADTIFELGITPNRPDALGHVGVAADLAVKLGRSLQPPDASLADVPAAEGLVSLEAPQRCGRYIGRTFEGAQVGDSPLWMRVRLHRLGLRPINNVVDVTNYVLMLWGQPLHAFDRAKLSEGRVVVRLAADGEPMTTLDGAELKLAASDLVIADAQRPQALAGVMGGQDSGVEAGATTLLLETAWFEPGFVRASARRHGLNTDSSYRFERGVDFGARLQGACATAEQLLCTLAGARVTGGVEVGGQVPPTPTITLREARVLALLGMAIPRAEIHRVLTGLEISLEPAGEAAWRCIPPTHRPDLTCEEDLIEELLRHYGLDRLPSTPSLPSEPPGMRVDPGQRAADATARLEDAVLDAMRAENLQEVLAFAFTDPADLEPFGVPADRTVKVTNPLRMQTSVMRTHMMPGLLRAGSVNVARHARAVRLCEVGRIYDWPEASQTFDGATAEVDALLPRERRRAAFFLCAGSREAAAYSGSSAATIAASVLSRLGARAAIRPARPAASWLHPGVQARVEVDGVAVGEVGEVHPDLMAQFDFPEGVRGYYGELWLESLRADHVARHQALPRFPSTSRDLSLEIPIRTPASAVTDALARAEAKAEHAQDGPRLAQGDTAGGAIEIVEDYRGAGVPEGHRALLLRLHYRAPGRSVTDDEVQALHGAVVQAAVAALCADVPSIRVR
ncbi:MAG: phenylalanine--tRNA ligase subunit beta [Nannocystaceae bacterium]|nr:phenylalanine--tRNA ligase subunit beta [bacterium]